MEIRKRCNLKEYMFLRRCDHFDLPRKFDEFGKLVPLHGDTTAGWYCIIGDVKSVIVKYDAFKNLADAIFFAENVVFEYRDVATTKATAIGTLAAIRHRKGLENYVDLSGQKVAK